MLSPASWLLSYLVQQLPLVSLWHQSVVLIQNNVRWKVVNGEATTDLIRTVISLTASLQSYNLTHSPDSRVWLSSTQCRTQGGRKDIFLPPVFFLSIWVLGTGSILSTSQSSLNIVSVFTTWWQALRDDCASWACWLEHSRPLTVPTLVGLFWYIPFARVHWNLAAFSHTSTSQRFIDS